MRAAFWVLAAAGCATAALPPAVESPSRAPAAAEEERDDSKLAPPTNEYRTTPYPNGVVGGRDAAELARTIGEALRERGGQAEADGALAAVAGWFLSETAVGRSPDIGEGERVARQLGFAGPVLTAVAFGLEGGQRDLWRRALSQLPGNIPVTRYGIRASPGARAAAVVFGAMEASLDPFPRRLTPGQTLTLRGEIGKRFDHGHVYLTGADGRVKDTPLARRRVSVSLEVPVPGIYKVEVMGDGPTGPVVLVNVPVYVGVPETPVAAPMAGHGAPPAPHAEGRLLSLLNEARAKAGLAALSPDPELRALALAHTEDMAKNGFFGHVSPTTGSVEDRARRAGVIVSALGENIAQAGNAEMAHQTLMDSPGHRANMVRASFTHVGIAVVALPGNQLLTTLVFGRRAPSQGVEVSVASALEAIALLRSAKGVAPLAPDSALRAAAEAGIQIFRAKGSPQAALAAANAVLRRRPRSSPRSGCAQLFELLELAQLEQYPLLVDPHLRGIGLAVATRKEGMSTILALLVVVEGVACR